ncbi:MAG: zinc-binding dehydrogenase [Paracoccaceae bacterium]|nr:zinc-binding dehydrogenase [Paracoccaceae bacterium]
MPKAWVIHGYEGYQGLSLEEVPDEAPGPGEVRLRVEAFALNWGDMDLMHDRYSFSFSAFPACIGMEAAGIVDAIGPGVTGIELGTRMCTLPYFYDRRGASTEQLVIDHRYVTPAPEGLSAVESASVWMMYMTAYFPLVEIMRVLPGGTVLVTAGTGTAGTAALEIGRHFGARMIATSRFAHNRRFLEAVGADHVFVPGSCDLAEFLKSVTDGRGIDAAFDPIGAGMIGQYAPALARDARIFFYGTLDGEFPTLPIVDMFQANAVFHPYSLFHYVENLETQARGTTFVYDALKRGLVAPRIDRIYPMEGYRDAWDYVSAPRKTHGKVVVETGA